MNEEKMTSTGYLELKVKKLEEENRTLQEVIKVYQSHIEKVIEMQTIKNREVARTTPQFIGEEVFNRVQDSMHSEQIYK
ncbi:hypothetical protein IGI96_000944 [Enterococcus sp. DIV0421]|uniref:hypothetical protein n=1 Tax=Enterococcus sp. DIV0421 TaxID=2774688 RepID=UPI003F1FB469